MRLVKCDRHPDRDAVASFRIIELPVGSRPIIIGMNADSYMIIDVCQECKDQIPIKENHASE